MCHDGPVADLLEGAVVEPRAADLPHWQPIDALVEGITVTGYGGIG